MLQVHRQSHRRTEHADDGADDNPGEADEPILRQPRAGQPGVSEASHRGDRHVSIAANHGRAHERKATRVGGGGGHLPLRADMARGSRGWDRRQAHLGESRLVRSPRQSFTPSFTPGYLPLPGASGYRTTDLSVTKTHFKFAGNLRDGGGDHLDVLRRHVPVRGEDAAGGVRGEDTGTGGEFLFIEFISVPAWEMFFYHASLFWKTLV